MRKLVVIWVDVQDEHHCSLSCEWWSPRPTQHEAVCSLFQCPLEREGTGSAFLKEGESHKASYLRAEACRKGEVKE